MTQEARSNLKHIRDPIGALVARYGIGQVTAQRELELAWAKAAGDEFAAHTRVGSLRRGVLEILVDNASLLQELDGFHKANLLEALQAGLRHNRVARLVFRRS